MFICVHSRLIPSAAAQLQNLDKNTLIDGLRASNMGELLKRYAQTEKFDDPADELFLLYSQELLDFSRLQDDYRATGDTAQRDAARQAFDRALAYMNQLIDEHRDHLKRPLWQTDFGELQLSRRLFLLEQYATLFKEFGVVTAEQDAAFEDGADRAVSQMIDAELRLFQTVGDLPKRPDFAEMFDITGLWRRVNEEYYQLKTPFYLTQAAYFATLLRDDAPYFSSLKQHPTIPPALQRDTPAQERVRLLEDAARRIDDLLAKQRGNDSVRAPMLSLMGRIRLAQGKPAEAMTALNEAVKLALTLPNPTQGQIVELTSRLALARTHFAAKRTPQAFAELDQLNEHPLVTADLSMRLLVTDLRHRLMLEAAGHDAAGTDAVKVSAAYQVYLDLLADSAVPDSARQALRFYIYRRWESSLSQGASFDRLPLVVVAGIAEMARSEGQNLFNEGDVEAAAPKLERAIQAATDVIARKAQGPDAAVAQAMLDLGMSRYFLGGDDPVKQVESARAFVDLIEAYPDATPTAEALGNAQFLLRAMHPQRPPVPGVDELYRRFVDILLKHHPDSSVLADERYDYAVSVLVVDGKAGEAVAFMDAIPPGAANYWNAQAETLNLLQRDPDADAAALAERARRVEADALDALPGADESVQPAVLRAAGVATLTRAEQAIRADRPTEAVELLAGFEDRYEQDAYLLSFGLEKRITALVQAQQYEQAAEQAQRMMARFPGDAAYVIDQSLRRMEQLIDQLNRASERELVAERKAQLKQQAKQVASTAVKLADLLLSWAKEQGFTQEELVPYQVSTINALRVAGEPEKARGMLDELLAAYPNDPDVIFNAAEIDFKLGGGESGNVNPELLAAAGGRYNTLIGGLQPGANGQYPELYWRAWMRRLQINDRLNEYVEDIFFRVSQLEQYDPTLGGEPMKSELTRLKLKHAP